MIIYYYLITRKLLAMLLYLSSIQLSLPKVICKFISQFYSILFYSILFYQYFAVWIQVEWYLVFILLFVLWLLDKNISLVADDIVYMADFMNKRYMYVLY